jgi:site-specific recombinase XerD
MEVQQQLRHVNLSTTQIYLHEAEKAKNRCTDLISDEIF